MRRFATPFQKVTAYELALDAHEDLAWPKPGVPTALNLANSDSLFYEDEAIVARPLQ